MCDGKIGATELVPRGGTALVGLRLLVLLMCPVKWLIEPPELIMPWLLIGLPLATC